MTILNTLTEEGLKEVRAIAAEGRLPVVWTEKKALAHFWAKITPKVVMQLADEIHHRRQSETADREMLKRLAVIMSGSDTPGEIRSLTVTAQSLVDRCKQLARERAIIFSNPSATSIFETYWEPASPEEVGKRSEREARLPPTREETRSEGELISCPRCGGDSHRLARRV